MQKEEGKMLVDEQVMPGVLAEEKPAEQGVPVPMEETEQIVKNTEEAVEEKEKADEKEEEVETEDEDTKKDESRNVTEKETEGVVLSETTLKAMDEEQEKAAHTTDKQEVVLNKIYIWKHKILYLLL